MVNVKRLTVGVPCSIIVTMFKIIGNLHHWDYCKHCEEQLLYEVGARFKERILNIYGRSRTSSSPSSRR